MKKAIVKVIIMSSIGLSGVVSALDLSMTSNDDLFAMKDQVRTMSEADRSAYRTEHQGRMSSMDQTERDARFSEMGASGRKNMENNCQRGGSRKRDGSGGGQQRGKGGGEGGASRRGGGGRYGSGY